MGILDFLLPVISLLFLLILLSPRIRTNSFWQASVTPLASIIGSGFLIVAPLLGGIFGTMTPWAMLLIVAVAYLIGSAIRFNIRHAEPLFENGAATAGQRLLERVSGIGLSGAYIISVAFYLRLMAAFILHGVGLYSEPNANMLTTAVLVFIGIAGWRRGLKGLERLEEYSVSVKLAVIAAFLLGLGFHGASADFWGGVPVPQQRPAMETLQLLAGMLLVVQGFETSRYLGNEYTADMRVRSMRFAQRLSALIYVAFALLILPLLRYLPMDQINEIAIIDLSRHVSLVLPVMLVLAAVMSQFSAAVADTLGGGGLIAEESRSRISPGHGYLLIATCAIALVWSTSIFEIVAYASRAFAFYYFAQTILALTVMKSWPAGRRKWLLMGVYGLLSGALAWVTLFAESVG